MAPSAVVDNDNIMLLLLLAGCHFRVIASVLYDADVEHFYRKTSKEGVQGGSLGVPLSTWTILLLGHYVTQGMTSHLLLLLVWITNPFSIY